MRIVEFLKSLVFPRSMQKYRYMSVLIAVFIFVASMYAFILPTKVNYDKRMHNEVVQNNVIQLQSILYIPELNTEINNFVNEMKNKECYSEKSVLTCDKLGLFEVMIDNNLLGVITKDTVNNVWLIDNKNTNISFTDVTAFPTITALDSKIKIGPSNTEYSFDNITADETIDVIKISVDNRGLLLIDDKITDKLITSMKADIKVVEGKLVIDDYISNVSITNKTFIYFIPNTEVKFYEKNISYAGDDGIVKNIKFIIDLEFDYSGTNFTYSSEKYPNTVDGKEQEYFFVVVDRSYLYYQAYPTGIENENIVHNDVKLISTGIALYYNTKDINFNSLSINEEGKNNLGKVITEDMEYAINKSSLTYFTFIAFLFSVFYTLFVAFVFFILFKRNGKLRTFKEYYNIAAISSIVPTLITFIAMWITPNLFTYTFPMVFVIYYIFVIYRINSTPDLA